jgi:hypothetical protein
MDEPVNHSDQEQHAQHGRNPNDHLRLEHCDGAAPPFRPARFLRVPRRLAATTSRLTHEPYCPTRRIVQKSDDSPGWIRYE